ncbi:hypothetical protein [uncultured Duncaniella sp.]|uniref:hypothetical protein n=1 Tax=uncultured Duncaniella sp. TaxID=2768039 RepID=UPI0025A4DDA4|nr:hypothetical protein [uncultured Duncaniella sp.]
MENAVKLLYQSVYLDIEGMALPSLDELNTAIHISLHDFNEKRMAGRKMSRKDMFLQGEKDFLRSQSRGDTRPLRHPLHLRVEEGTQPAGTLRPV